jgi:GH15 family glucan-1,4-alpha-glucosidase
VASSYPPIEDYAIIGDCGSAALVSKDGCIDWLCWPRFDSPSVFGALLDREQGGCFRIGPAAEDSRVARRYLDDTNVLETTFYTESGVFRLTDAMPVAEAQAYRDDLWPMHEVLRRVECVEGAVEVEITCAPRLDYGRREPNLQQRGNLGFFYQRGRHVLVVRSEAELERSDEGGVLSARVRLEKGERRFLSLAYDEGEPAVLPLLGSHAEERLQQTARYWRAWAGRCQYDGPYEEAVVRSILTLKLMTFAASGALIAAPTTSLPEVPGGEKNYDYRYCWLRDAAFTLRVFFALGYEREGHAFFEWLLQATQRTFPDLNVLYTIYGSPEAPEVELDHLDGYGGARPVRIGNQARGQYQLDVYGEIVSAAYEFALHVEEGFDRSQRKRLRRLGEAICDRWTDADNGIWELRGDWKHRTYSKAMCWVGLERLRRLAEAGHLTGGKLDTERFADVQEQIRREIEERGFSEATGSYMATYQHDRLDASLLLLVVYEYTGATDDRMAATYERVEEHLGTDGGLLYRFPGEGENGECGAPPEEGAFGICSFWAVEYLAKAGRTSEARERFEQVCACANDVGLFPEEIDPDSGAFLGNFPQAFTHVGLIKAALALQDAADDTEGECAKPTEAARDDG